MPEGTFDRPGYGGFPPQLLGAVPHPGMHQHPGVSLHGFCPSCCHPKPKCGCGCLQCRKEPKEVLVKPTLTRGQIAADDKMTPLMARAAFLGRAFAAGEPIAGEAMAVGIGNGFIGGGCCVHLSVEYAPSTPTAQAMVVVLVDDAEGTILAWGKKEQPGAGYQIKECIITTKPGADLNVLVLNATARVRWCEIFSC